MPKIKIGLPLFLFISLLLNSCGISPEYQAQDLVKKYLKAPATAKFVDTRLIAEKKSGEETFYILKVT
ncbi:MAG: hypothetical protein D4R73_11760, partial [Deltaproteobacteria bacterium]